MNASEMGYLIRVDPKEARRRIVEALKAAKMHRGKAAQRLGCTHGTLIQWTHRLAMEAEVKRLDERAEREGWRDETAGAGGRRPGAGRPAKPKVTRRSRVKKLAGRRNARAEV